MITDGLKLMVMGMGMVFVFLTLMVIIMSLAAKVLAPFAHLIEEASPKASKKTASKSPKKANTDQAAITAAIAAVHMYRQERS